MHKTETIDYQDGETTLEAYCAYPAGNEKKPAVLVVHDWSGKNEFACEKARQLAELGYVGFALDMYGKGKMGHTKEEKTALMEPLSKDRSKLIKRILAAYDTVKQLDAVNPRHIGAIGFCFGGLCALDLARSGADVAGVVSFHGLLHGIPNHTPKSIKAKVLILHGYDDPMAKPDQVISFANEMTAANVDWQINMYSQTMHGFTNPEANDPSFGTVFNKRTTERAWFAMRHFFNEIFQ